MNNSGLYFGPTQGLSSPKNSQRGCLCPHSDEYLRECCDGSLQAQGVGVIQSAFTNTGSFSDGFDDGFNNGSPL
jgi:hypothetical protein